METTSFILGIWSNHSRDEDSLLLRTPQRVLSLHAPLDPPRREPTIPEAGPGSIVPLASASHTLTHRRRTHVTRAWPTDPCRAGALRRKPETQTSLGRPLAVSLTLSPRSRPSGTAIHSSVQRRALRFPPPSQTPLHTHTFAFPAFSASADVHRHHRGVYQGTRLLSYRRSELDRAEDDGLRSEDARDLFPPYPLLYPVVPAPPFPLILFSISFRPASHLHPFPCQSFFSYHTLFVPTIIPTS